MVYHCLFSLRPNSHVWVSCGLSHDAKWIYNFVSLSTNVALWQWSGLTDKLQRNQQRLLQTTLFFMPRMLEITFPSLLRLFFRHIFHNTTSGHLWKKLSKPLHCRQLLPHWKVWRTSSQLISSSPFLMPRTNKIGRIGIKFIGHIYFLKNMRYIFLLNSDSRSCMELYEYNTY